MLTTLLILSLILATVAGLWRYIRAQRRLERALMYGPRWSYHRTLTTEHVSDEDVRIGGEHARWQAMGPFRREGDPC